MAERHNNARNYVTNEWFRRAVGWLHMQGNKVTDRQIASDTKMSYQMISNYRGDHSPLSHVFITRFEEAYLKKFGYRLDYFENLNGTSHSLSDNEQAIVMLNTKIERNNEALAMLLEGMDTLKQQNELLLKKVDALEKKAKK